MTRALLVIDVQQEYFDGALPISYPAGHLDAILQVMDNAAKAGVPTVRLIFGAGRTMKLSRNYLHV